MKEHCVIFVHGFFGGKNSFKNNLKVYFSNYLTESVKNKYDFDYSFVYYSKPNYFKLDKYLLLLRYVPLFKNFISPGYNDTIDNLAKALFTKYEGKLECGYKTVSFICHSMGGIIAKRTVLYMCESDMEFKGKYISLATPHKGVKIGKTVKMSNIQSVEIAQNSDLINSLSEGWNRYKNRITRQYYCGNGDPIVGLDIAFPEDLDEHKIVLLNEDHDTISKPYKTDSDLINKINRFL